MDQKPKTKSHRGMEIVVMTLNSSRGNRKPTNKNSRDKLKYYHNINKSVQ